MEGADLDGRGYAIDIAENRILINTNGLSKGAIARSDYFSNLMTLRVFAGLRAAWQAERQEGARQMHRPDLWLLLARISEADIAVMAIRMAFEAGTQRDETLWRHALGDENGDMAIAYAQTLERLGLNGSDAPALTKAFETWFSKHTRISQTDLETLSEMDAAIEILKSDGKGQISEGAVRCLAIDPLSGGCYLGRMAFEIAGDPAWRTITDPIVEAHFLQVMDDIGTVRMGAVACRDKKLAARLFPDALVKA
ncbi:MAG: hypothetical protein EBQ96_07045 [Proteobacteria bacterium]|nr:hypothetical protein [Pseudomonadota bacterium]